MFNKIEKVDPRQCTCHSGGAVGSDKIWEKFIAKCGGKTNAYSYQTDFHKSPNKIEISDDDYQEGVIEVRKANSYLNRPGFHKYMNLLARNWAQVKYSDQLFAIGNLVRVGDKNVQGYRNKGKRTAVNGGSGFAVMMAIIHEKPVFVFDQNEEQWYKWSYIISDYIRVNVEDVYIISKNFAGVGTRSLNISGAVAIRHVLINSRK
jgi:hypothetical protein